MNPEDDEDRHASRADNAAGGTYQLAARSSRLGAFILDMIITLFLCVPAVILGLNGQYMDAANEETGGDVVAFIIITLLYLGEVDVLLLTLVYLASYLVLNTYLLARRGQTLAKYLFGIAIVDHESGRVAPIAKVIGLRILPFTAVNLIPLPGDLLLLLANYVCIFGNPRRCVHDYLCGTSVIKVPKRGLTAPTVREEA